MRGPGAPKEGCGPREGGGCTPRGRDADPGTTSAGLRDPGSRTLRDGQTAAPRRREDARPGPAWEGLSQGWGCGVRRGGTALNALDSPAPALSPPSSPDSWGLCFLHPPGRPRSAPAAHVTRRLPLRPPAGPPGAPRPGPPLPGVRGAVGDRRPPEAPGRSEATRRLVSWKGSRELG